MIIIVFSYLVFWLLLIKTKIENKIKYTRRRYFACPVEFL